MKNTIEKKICETAMSLEGQAHRISPLFTAFVEDPEDSFSLDEGVFAVEEIMCLIEELEMAVKASDYKNPLVSLMVKDALKLMTRGTDILANIVAIYPNAEACCIQLVDIVKTLDDFYDEHIERWEDIEREWGMEV